MILEHATLFQVICKYRVPYCISLGDMGLHFDFFIKILQDEEIKMVFL